jgi:periplasmic protein TonB
MFAPLTRGVARSAGGLLLPLAFLAACATAPAPAESPVVQQSAGRDPVAAEAEATSLEAEAEAQMLDALEALGPAVAQQPAERDLAALTLEMRRLQAQINARIAEFERRPRKKFIGGKIGEARFAKYEQQWRQQIERVGEEHYPEEARGGRLSGSLRLTVTIRPDGKVEAIELDRSSGHDVLDRAAVRIVELASPFQPFPDEINLDTDFLVITRTWFFGRQPSTVPAQ